MHICGEEIVAFCSAIPALGLALAWCKAKYHTWKVSK